MHVNDEYRIDGTEWAQGRRKVLLIVLIFGILLGYFVYRTYFSFQQHSYPISFEKAEWITTPAEGAQGYFRKELYLTDEVQHAWLKISASDSYILFINGESISSNRFDSMNVSGIYNIENWLSPGKNVIAVEVRRRALPMLTGLAVQGAYRGKSGLQGFFITDRTWRSSLYEERQGRGDIMWYAEDFNDSVWEHAHTQGSPITDGYLPVDIHPEVITEYPQAHIIWHQDPAARFATFVKSVDIDTRPREAWIRVAAPGNFAISVNDMMLGNNFSDISKSMHIYNVGPFINKGRNNIVIQVDRQTARAPGLFVDGFIMADGETVRIQSDSTWESSVTSSLREEADSRTLPPFQPALIVSSSDALKLGEYEKKYDKIVLPDMFILKRTIVAISVMIATSLFTVILWMGISMVWERLSGLARAEALELLALSHIPSILFLVFLYLLRYDVYHDSLYPFQNKFVFGALGILLIFELIMIGETIVRSGRGDNL